MARAFTILVVFQLLGEIIAQGTGLPLPGPVIGLILLLSMLVVTGGPSAELASTSRGLLGYLGLLFVPAGVGVVTKLDVLRQEWLPISVAILVSTVLTLVVTGLVMQRLARPDLPADEPLL